MLLERKKYAGGAVKRQASTTQGSLKYLWVDDWIGPGGRMRVAGGRGFTRGMFIPTGGSQPSNTFEGPEGMDYPAEFFKLVCGDHYEQFVAEQEASFEAASAARYQGIIKA